MVESCPAASPITGVTSLVDLGLPVTMHDLDLALLEAFREVFGPAGTAQTLNSR